MPHERGLLPVPPSEFCCHCSRRSQSSLLPLARQPLVTVNSVPPCPEVTFDTKALKYLAPPRQSAWPCSGRATLACHYHLFQDAPPAPLHSCENRNEPKRRATTIVARPGPACKSLPQYPPNWTLTT